MNARRLHLAALLVVVFYGVVLLLGLKSAALTDDDDFYIPAGISYAGWLKDAALLESRAFDRARVDAAFTINREHPPFAKYAFGVCHFAFKRWLGPTDAARVGTVLFSTLAAALLFVLAFSVLEPKRAFFVGLYAVLALLTLPRFYFHSHAATLDVPVAAMYLATAVLILRSERSMKAVWLVGPVFGLATATKLNAPFIVLPYLAFVVLTRWRDRDRTRGLGFKLPPIPVAMISMAVLGPLVFFAVWPWMWFDLAPRVAEYVKFHVNHYAIYFLYFGQIYAKPFAPWHAPFVMAATTIPLATSALALTGATKALRKIAARFMRGGGPETRREADALLFVLLNAASTIGLVAFAGTPIYGGEKLFMPFFPFWCFLAGYGAEALVAALEEKWQSRGGRLSLRVAFAGVASSGLMLQLAFAGYPLSQFNGLVGGLRGATALGFERQYYDLAFRDLVAWLSREAPENLRIHFLPNNWEYVRTYKWYREAGELRADIQVTQQESGAEWLVITHERRFARYGEDLARYRAKPVLREKLVDGVPIWSVVRVRERER